MSDTPFRRIDIHAHLQSEEFDPDRAEAFRRALGDGTAIVNVGTDIESSRRAVELAEAYPEGVYAVVGLHPTDTAENFDPAAYHELARHPKVVGIGECGLDYFRMPEGADVGKVKAAQKELFSAQIALANEVGKPLMLHIRSGKNDDSGALVANAYADAQEMLRAEAKVKGNSHFFAGSIDDARGFLDLGYTMSFTGAITFARQYEELIEYVPLDMMHAETDCPFVAPVPYRGKRNEPAYVSAVVEKIARVKKLPLADVESALLANARRVWGVKV